MFRIQLSFEAARDRDRHFDYLRQFSAEAAEYHVARLDQELEGLADGLVAWNFFFVTGAPYHAKLFKISRQRQLWIVYRIGQDEKIIRILRIWDTRQNPLAFKL